jgi:sulfite oxidase
VAARSVKWVNSIAVCAEESKSHWQRNDYKGFSPSADWDHLDWTQSESIQEMPVQSAILDPRPNSAVDADATDVTVKGYAWSGGGRGITRVDVSSDGGKTWHAAELSSSKQRRNKVWAWTQWEATVPVAEGTQPVELVCKAVDTSYNVQPDSFQGIYNRRGVLSNAWHRLVLPRKHE